MKKFLIIESKFYQKIAELSLSAAESCLEQIIPKEFNLKTASVPGVMEIPAALNFYVQSAQPEHNFDAFVVLGCVIRGETSHHEHVARECMRGLTDLCLKHSLALGNGILTCENYEQALKRAEKKGSAAAHAANYMLRERIRTLGP